MNKVNPNLQQILNKIDFFKPLSPVVKKLISLLDNPESEMEEIRDVILLDPALTADVLRISNSAFLALRQKVTSIKHAIVILGRKNLKKIVFTSQMGTFLKSDLKGYPTNENSLWEHSLITAIAAEIIASKLGYPDKEQAYIVGLLHDIGKIVLDPLVSKYKEQIEKEIKNDRPALEIEKELFGLNHAEIGGMIAKKWDLPTSIQEAITFHHSPTEAQQEVMLSFIAYLANNIAVGMCPVGFDLEAPIESQLLDEVGLSPADTEEITLRILAAKEEIAKL